MQGGKGSGLFAGRIAGGFLFFGSRAFLFVTFCDFFVIFGDFLPPSREALFGPILGPLGGVKNGHFA